MDERFKVNEELSVGRGQPGEGELRQLASEGFRAVIDLRQDSEGDGALSPAEEADASRRLGLTYWHFAVPTDRLRSAMLDRFRGGVASLPKPIFVHCASGKRSGSFALAAATIEAGLSGDVLLGRAAAVEALYGSASMQRKLRRYVDRNARRGRDALRPTAQRAEAQTTPAFNRRIADQTRASIHYYAAHTAEIETRLAELDREWDMERTLETNAAALAFAGTLLGATLDRRFLVLPLLVSGFLLQHALKGWCPPVVLFRRLGVRSAAEIERERAALKALRGDFRGLDEPASPAAAEAAFAAAEA